MLPIGGNGVVGSVGVLVAAEGLDGVDFCGSPTGDGAGGYGDEEEQRGDCDEGQRVDRVDVVEEAGEDGAIARAPTSPTVRPLNDQLHAIAEDHREDLGFSRRREPCGLRFRWCVVLPRTP